eukprot:313465-Prymnesium_polylepis.1
MSQWPAVLARTLAPLVLPATAARGAAGTASATPTAHEQRDSTGDSSANGRYAATEQGCALLLRYGFPTQYFDP